MRLAMPNRAAVSLDDDREVRPAAETHSTEPSAVSAAERAVEAAQKIAVERLELMRLEFMDGIAGLMQRAGLMLAAGLIAILGWCGLAVAVVVMVAERLPLATAIALVAGTHVLLGLVLGVAAMSMTRRKTT
jgi:uncharacterized membrane protein YqjE